MMLPITSFRLALRQDVYYHRAAIPADIRDTYPKTEQTFSLKTKNPREAVLLVRKAAVEVDERFEAHRRLLVSEGVQHRDELADAEISAVEEAYYTHLLDEDDEKRLLGFYDGEQLPLSDVIRCQPLGRLFTTNMLSSAVIR